ncbi:AGAP013258-PA-like protein [Anopheles sinensis]|uniref:AGAP013258-PA-like protein n=1 Tax=Anopheles sinensis TaxID=74873 RepID=A0A084VLQ8_ANOSI|nr:AGAP013258-PA-like protein [Anopheles sinensis]
MSHFVPSFAGGAQQFASGQGSTNCSIEEETSTRGLLLVTDKCNAFLLVFLSQMSRPGHCVVLVACCLQLLTIGFHTVDGSVVASANDRDTRQHRAQRRAPDGDAVAEDRTNAIDQPLDNALQLKYYDVVAVDLVQSLSDAPNGGSLVAAGAGEGKQAPPAGETSAAPAMPTAKSESAKTLADQVAEGKYGLIHRELFQRRPQRLGVLNYRRNEEVPLDDERNYGGLRPDEIWLAEDHLLVLKGGSISFGSNRSAGGVGGGGSAGGDTGPWQPIDDYRAPERQVQIPANPAVPPPFPVQLREDGPIEFIRGDQVPAFNPFTNESAFLFTNKAFPVIRPEDLGGQNILARPAAHNATGQHHNGLQYPPPVNPPPLSDNRTYSNPFLKLPPPGPPLGPPLGRPPLGSLDDVPDNRTVGGVVPPFNGPPPDEDDPSLYYPPPYTFEYRGNYTNPVPPGPLVPGIILPPPPNFFILKPANASEPKRGNATAMKPTKAAGHQQQHRPTTSKATTTTTSTSPPPPPQSYPTSVKSAAKPIAPSRVEIQKAVLKTFVPVLEVYGTPAKGAGPATTTTPSVILNTSGKRQRVKPTVASSIGPSTHPTATPLLTPSTKLHKIPAETPARPAKPSAPPSSSQPIYAEYFNIKTSTVGPPAVWSSGDALSPPLQLSQPQLPRTYLPVAVVGKGGRTEAVGQVPPARHHNPEFLSTTYGYSPIEQFHREVQTIRQTLQLYEKANKLSKPGRTSKAHPAPVPAGPLQYHEPSAPTLSANLSLTYGGNDVYRTLFPEEVAPPAGGGYKGYTNVHTQPSFTSNPYEPTYVYRQPSANGHELPQSYYVTTGDEVPFQASFGRHTYSQQTPYAHQDIPVQHRQQQQHQQQQQQHFHHQHQQQQEQHHQQQQHQAYYQPQPQALPKYPSLPPHQTELSYIAPVILNNGASGYNRRPDFDGLSTTTSAGATSTSTTTTKSYLILDHRHVQGTPTHRLRPDRQRPQALADLPYFYRSSSLGYENGDGPGGGGTGEQPVPGQRNRYLDSDILVNYKHPLPVLNPDSEFLPYHHRLKVRKRQNVRGAGEHKPRQYFGQPLYNHR